jgi:hypothetical protein
MQAHHKTLAQSTPNCRRHQPLQPLQPGRKCMHRQVAAHTATAAGPQVHTPPGGCSNSLQQHYHTTLQQSRCMKHAKSNAARAALKRPTVSTAAAPTGGAAYLTRTCTPTNAYCHHVSTTAVVQSVRPLDKDLPQQAYPTPSPRGTQSSSSEQAQPLGRKLSLAGQDPLCTRLTHPKSSCMVSKAVIECVRAVAQHPRPQKPMHRHKSTQAPAVPARPVRIA